ncbi:MAG TPA: phosphotransferase [Mycobacteriales bacterium]|nr:phosphotransferase [Mycobacteriales bacterium]
MTTTPGAAGGPRLDWSQVPGPVRTGVDHLLGSPVASAVNQHGGFSPGPAVRVRCADGSRAFVKAVGLTLNPDSPRLHRAEGRNAACLPATARVPRLRGVYDDGDWVALVFDEIDGSMPVTPWRPADVDRVLTALLDLARVLTPCPADHVPDVADRIRADVSGYARLAATPPVDLSDWERQHLDWLAGAGPWVLDRLSGDTLVHLDLRADNILFDDSGRTYFVDWPWASRGPAWVDTALFLINVALHGGDPESFLRDHPLLTDVAPEEVTGLLVGVTGMFGEACRKPAPPGLPTLRDFQRAQYQAMLRWVRRRTG